MISTAARWMRVRVKIAPTDRTAEKLSADPIFSRARYRERRSEQVGKDTSPAGNVALIRDRESSNI